MFLCSDSFKPHPGESSAGFDLSHEKNAFGLVLDCALHSKTLWR